MKEIDVKMEKYETDVFNKYNSSDLLDPDRMLDILKKVSSIHNCEYSESEHEVHLNKGIDVDFYQMLSKIDPDNKKRINVYENCNFTQNGTDIDGDDEVLWNIGFKKLIFINCKLDEIKWDALKFEDVVFVNCSMRESEFNNCEFNDVHFFSCNLYKSEIKSTNFDTVSIYRTNLRRVKLIAGTILNTFINLSVLARMIIDDVGFIQSTFNRSVMHGIEIGTNGIVLSSVMIEMCKGVVKMTTVCGDIIMFSSRNNHHYVYATNSIGFNGFQGYIVNKINNAAKYLTDELDEYRSLGQAESDRTLLQQIKL